MKRMVLVVGVIGVLLGALWLLQGKGAVRIQPLLCVADCEAIQGASSKWAIIGFLTAAAGVLAIVHSLRA
jgi:hypothetical protein